MDPSTAAQMIAMAKDKRFRSSIIPNLISMKTKTSGPWKEDYQKAGKNKNGHLLSIPSILLVKWVRRNDFISSYFKDLNGLAFFSQ